MDESVTPRVELGVVAEVGAESGTLTLVVSPTLLFTAMLTGSPSRF